MPIELPPSEQQMFDDHKANGINLIIVESPNANANDKFACQDIVNNNDRNPFFTGYGETAVEAFLEMDKTIRDSGPDLSNPAPPR